MKKDRIPASPILKQMLNEKGMNVDSYTIEELRRIKKVEPKIMFFDIETSLLESLIFNTGMQYVGYKDLKSETQIITVAWKWLGDEKVRILKWDNKKKSDKELVREFIKEIRKADLIVGWNSKSFDTKIVAARAMKYGFEFDVFVKQLDLMREFKRLFRLPSYALNYAAKYLELGSKLEHEGKPMWEKIQFGNKKESKKALKKMCKYNIKDTQLTEYIFLKIQKYLKMPIHLGALIGNDKATCPICGSDDVELYKMTATAAGTIQPIMRCKHDKHKFKISNTIYINTL